ncbi:MAG TPA: CopG family transcriptional regulator [Vicinamibacteria bacterium]|nr:CopG family transcriptional regulator [Vicinamibacteria bacterium]
MIRTTVYVDEDVAVAIRHRAAVEGRTQAELIRDALRKYIEEAEIPERPPIMGIGRHRSGRRDVSDRAEELLRRAARRKRER